MIEYVNGDITKTELSAIAHGCNMQGKMGSGVAKAIRASFPGVYENYSKLVHYRSLGECISIKSNDKIIGNLLTQQNYGFDGKPYASVIAIRDSLDEFCYTVRSNLGEGQTIAIPKIGCGLGGLEWEKVVLVVEAAAKKHKLSFRVYEFDA